MELFSQEWAQRLANEVRQDADAQRHLRGLDADFQYLVTPAPSRGVTDKYAFGIHFRDCDSVWQGVRPDTPFTLTVGYELFHSALTGPVDVLQLLRSRQVNVKGSVTKLLRHGRGVARVLQVAKRIPASAAGEFPDVPGL